MIRHVFADVDLTFIGSDQIVKEGNLKALKKLKELGIGFSFCSGRLIIGLEELLNQVGTNHKDDEYAICSNGAIINNTKSDVFYHNPISKENMKVVLDYLFTIPDAKFNIVSSQMYYFNYLPESERYIKYPKMVICKEQMYRVVENEDIYKMVYFVEDQNSLNEIQSKIESITNNEVKGVLSSSVYLEFGNSDSDKGSGIKRFCELKGIDLKEILTIGDNFNDETMLEIAGYSACPANAVDEIKRKVDYISNKDCDDNAFADIIDHFIGN